VKEQIQEILEEARRSIPSCESDKDLEELRIKYLGKKSSLSDLLSKIGTVLKEKRPQMGALLNKVKKEIAQLIEQKKLVLHEQADATKAQGLDVTMPGRPLPIGAKHPLYQIWEEIEDIFINLGFEVAEGPEIESEYYNFDALNTPKLASGKKSSRYVLFKRWHASANANISDADTRDGEIQTSN